MLADNAEDFVIMSAENGQRLYISPSYYRVTGWTLEELQAPNWRTRLHTEDLPVIEEARMANLRGAATRIEHRILCKNGSWLWVENRCRPVLGSDGKVAAMIQWSRDITARKQAEEQLLEGNRRLEETLVELRQTQQQLIQQENLRAMGQMAAGIAHDFNNALSPIVAFSALMLEHMELLTDQKRSADYLQIINTCATDAAGVVRRLREFGRTRGAGDVSQAIDLPGLVRQTIELTQPRWKDEVQAKGLTIYIATDLRYVPPIVGEEYALREVLTNLIFNAVDAMPDGGTITLGTAEDGNFVRLSVSDTGTGMTEEVRQHCFEPFFTTKDEKGSGLGLAMVHGIVQRHGGTVEIKSEPGRGTMFIIRLPIQLAETKPTAVATDTSVPRRKLHVLAVDDEPFMRTSIEVTLMMEGHTVETVGSGAEALARLKEQRFDVLLADRAMPEMNGEQLAVAIHAIVPDLPVILMTGTGDIMKAAGEIPPHITAILSKPFTMSTLCAALDKAVPPQLTDKQ